MKLEKVENRRETLPSYAAVLTAGVSHATTSEVVCSSSYSVFSH